MKKALIVIVATLVLASLLLGCGKQSTTSTTSTAATTTAVKTTAASTSTTTKTVAKPKYHGILNMIQDSSPRVPGGWPWELFANDSAVPQLIYEPLLRGDPDGNLVPWLAKKYEIAEDYSSMTFYLRDDVSFTDGSKLDSTVAKWCLDNSIEINKPQFWQSVDIIDNYTVRLNFSGWQNTILSGMGDAVSTWMVSKKAYDDHGGADGGIDWLRMKPVGTGPFVFQSFQADSNYKVVRNNNYWGKDADGNQLPYLDGITTLFSTELTTRVALVKSGQADVMAYEPGKTAADLEALGLKLNGNINSVFWIRFDNANADSPFADKNVREAVAYAIDYDSIAQAFSYGYWKPVHQIAAQDAGATYDPNYTGIPYDVNKAKQLMQEAGKPNGFSCNMMVAPQGVDHDLIVAVQSYLAAINITITLQFPDIAGFFSSIMSPLPPGTLIFEGFGKMGASWNAGLAFGANPTGTYYVSFLKTDKYIELYNATMNSPKEDVTLVKNLLDYLQNEFYVVPIAGGGKGWATQPYVKDAGFNTRSWLPWWTFEKCWLDK